MMIVLQDKFCELVSEYFGEGMISNRINPDSCVAEGATLYAIQDVTKPETEPERVKPNTTVLTMVCALGAAVGTAVGVFLKSYFS